MNYQKIHNLRLQKAIMTPNGIFHSMEKAAKFYGVVSATITYRVNGKNEEWYFLKKEDYKI